MRILLPLALLLLISVSASAEYRVFELLITDQAAGTSRVYKSTLDDQQYAGYYIVKPTEKVTIQATWMCRERSEYFKDFCPNPRLASGAQTAQPVQAPAPVAAPK